MSLIANYAKHKTREVNQKAGQKKTSQLDIEKETVAERTVVEGFGTL